jgi:hypothetical protein
MEWVFVACWRNKCFFDCTHRSPSHKIDWSSCFIICTATSRSTKRLLTNNCACWFIIDIEISCRVAKCMKCYIYLLSVFTAPVKAYSEVSSSILSVSSYLSSSYTYMVSTGPKSSSHIVVYFGSLASITVGRIK